MSDTRTRWPNQIRAHAATLDAIDRGVKRLCITSPTGSGKTTIYTDALEWAVSEGKTASLFTHRKLLFSQICRNLTRDGIPFGMVASGQERDIAKPVQSIMVQTELSRRKRGYESAPSNIVLVDEYHQFGGDRFQEILQEHIDAGATMVGYTATPLDLVNIDELHVAATVPEMQAMGALVVADTYAPDEPDLRHIKNYQVGEDLTEKENTKAIMRPGVFARVVAAWREHNPDGLPTLLFGPDVAGSKFFAEQFHRAGIRAAHIDGDDVWLDGETLSSTQDVRDRLLAEYREGTIKVICNRFVMREGIDLPETGCMIFATVFGALSSYLQAGGRGLRACPERNKDKCICLDHGGNWHRHGSLNAARDWTLGMTNHRVVGERQERMREGQEPQPIVCPKCGKVRLSGRECPSCHFVAHKRSRMVVQIDGTLRPVEGDIYKPHRVKQYPNTSQLWQRMYYRAKNSRKGMTFRQAEALFLVENHYWPPRDLPFMPREPGDFWRKVSAVPRESLL